MKCLLRQLRKETGILFAGVLFAAALLGNPPSLAAAPLLKKSLDELMEMEVSVTSKSTLSQREAPGVVTVLTREEIQNSGATDLIEILRLIPGVQFGVDVQGAVGISIRGLWGHEGKVLLRWNGHEMNEILYSTNQFGGHYPIDEIERIEMIRGPGSVLYGGFAELAVIDITTVGAEGKGTSLVSATTGQTANTHSRDTVTAVLSGKLDELKLKASVYRGHAIRSDRRYTDMYGNQVEMKKTAIFNPAMFSLDANYKDLEVKLLADRYHTQQSDEYVQALSDDTSVNFDSYHALIMYPWAPTEQFTLKTLLSYKHQSPWYERFLPTGENTDYRRTIDRFSGQVSGNYSVNDTLSLLAGGDYTHDSAEDNGTSRFSNGKDSIKFWDYAAFAEVEARTDPAIIRAGVRIDQHEQFGSNVVPRLAITKAFEKLHFKFLASSAYRAPGIENISRNEIGRQEGLTISAIEPEETTVFEVETGYKFTKELQATINLFDMRIKKPIAYFFDNETQSEGYTNLRRVGTQGAEVDIKWLQEWGSISTNYSYYQAAHTDAETYEVPHHSEYLLGFAKHRIGAHANFRINDEIALNPTLNILGKRFGYTEFDAQENPLLDKFDPRYILNFNVGYTPQSLKNVRLSLGVANILNQRDKYIQPYNSAHAPLEAMSREFILKGEYKF